MADIDAMGSLLTNITPEIVEAIKVYFIRPYPKAVIWGNVFYNLLCTDFEKDTKYLAAKDEKKQIKFLAWKLFRCVLTPLSEGLNMP